jgi:hypothetical protein
MKNKRIYLAIAVLLLVVAAVAILCKQQSSTQKMVVLLKQLADRNYTPENSFCPEIGYLYSDSLLTNTTNRQERLEVMYTKASLAVKVGKEQEAVNLYEDLASQANSSKQMAAIMPELGLAYMRLGERTNCMLNHTGSSCIFPIKGEGVHTLQTGSKNAIDVYQAILKVNPGDMESRWLLNIAYMTLGQYPQSVPKAVLIPGLNADTANNIKPFVDIAPSLGLNFSSRSGGAIVDDFNNDGYMDIITSGWDLTDPMHYFQNNKNGTFSDVTEKSGLTGIKGGLNIQQTDYNNDGNMDVFVVRGAWLTKGFGNQPGSLLRNNGDGTFTDVTMDAGLLYFHPTQTATWADFNGDGWIDLFVGVENRPGQVGKHACLLYLNNQDGTFTDVSKKSHSDIKGFVKEVVSGDYNNDGKPDIFISAWDGQKHLLKNITKPGGDIDFVDEIEASGMGNNKARTFTTWFYDYDNDGWQDILVSNSYYSKSLAYYAGAEALGKPVPEAGNVYLYHNNHNGTFTNVTTQAGLNKVVFSMGGNFGDIDNDGYLDMYFGTGNPDYKSLIPNKMFHNIGGKKFVDVTTTSRTGNLQKGHGVAFADIRNIGTQDIFEQIGGAYSGDAYTSSLYLNPGQNNNNWISLKLDGVKANKAAVGSRIKITFTENGAKRSVYKVVSSGGSLGSSPMQQEVGIGQAKSIDEIEITWAGSGTIQKFSNVAPRQFLQITEGNNTFKVNHPAKLTFKDKKGVAVCVPMIASLK